MLQWSLSLSAAAAVAAVALQQRQRQRGFRETREESGLAVSLFLLFWRHKPMSRLPPFDCIVTLVLLCSPEEPRYIGTDDDSIFF